MDKRYLPSDETGKIIHLMEECAEVTKACAKVLRFGWDSSSPYPWHENISNRHQLLSEMEDVEFAIGSLREEMDNS